MIEPRKLLWVDCIAGGLVGVAVLALHGWLAPFYGLPEAVVLTMGAANLAYATYSFSLARRAQRPMALLVVLVVANATWAVLCVAAAAYFAGTATVFGMAQLLGEGLFVGGLAALEWRYRDQLQTAEAPRGG